MTCETCKHWEFPTLAIYQNMATKGICSRKAIKDGTGPDETCDRYIFEEKSPEFKYAASMAHQAGGMMKLGDKLNKPSTVEDLKKSIEQWADKLTPPTNEAKIGDMLIPHYIHPMQYVAANDDGMGNVTELVLKKADGKLLVLGVDECQFLRPR